MSPNTVGKTLVLCFPFAGGTGQFFDILDRDTLDGVELVKLEYAGHGSRIREPLYQSFEALVADLYPQICDLLSNKGWCRFAFFGYSMGCLAAFSVLQKMVEEELQHLPVHLFFAAHPPMPLAEIQNMRGTQLDDWVKERTVAFGAVPEKLLYNHAFWRMYLPVYTADYKMISAYDFARGSFSSDLPMTAFYSEMDTPLQDMQAWKKYFTGDIQFIRYEGSHFFIKEHHADMMRVIVERLS